MVEILMATYNGAAFLREQLDSVLNQDDGDWHLTVSDDGSDDGTAEIIEEYVTRFPTKISRHQSGRRFGNAKEHFLYLLRQSEAEWVFLCDQDDVWFPGKLRRMREAIREAEEAYGSNMPLLVFSDQIPTDARLRALDKSLMRYQKQYVKDFDYRSILLQNVVTGGAAAVNRKLISLALSCGDDTRMLMHDWWLAAVAARFGKIIFLNEALGYYRQHEGNAVGAKAVGSLAYFWKKITSPGAVRSSIRKKKEQARLFYQTYRGRLKETDAAFLRGFIKRRSGIQFYIKYRKLIHGAQRRAGFIILG